MTDTEALFCDVVTGVLVVFEVVVVACDGFLFLGRDLGLRFPSICTCCARGCVWCDGVVAGVEVVSVVVEVSSGSCVSTLAGMVAGGGSIDCGSVTVAGVGVSLVVAGVCEGGNAIGMVVDTSGKGYMRCGYIGVGIW